jgi:UrcA family protein
MRPAGGVIDSVLISRDIQVCPCGPYSRRRQFLCTPPSRTDLEINMNINAPVLSAKSFIYMAVLAACALLSGPIQAKERIVTVKVSVNTAGLDVAQPAGGRELYSRLAHAAAIVCGGTNQVGLQAVDSFADCIAAAVGEAVRSAKLPQLTVAYLRTHTLQQAAALGIDVPAVLIAAR